MIPISELSAYISIFFFGLLIIFIIWFIFYFSKWANKNLIPAFSKIGSEPEISGPVYNVPVASTSSEFLKNDCLNDTKLRDFFYLNDPIITELFSQIDSKQKIKQIETTTTNEGQKLGGSINSPIAGVDASLNETKNQQIQDVSNYILSQSSNCKKIMKRLYGENQVYILDITERDYNPSIEEDFNKCCEILRNKCHAPLPEYWFKIYLEQVRKYATSCDDLKKEIEETIQDKRYVITKGDFGLAENIFTKNIGDNKIIIEIPFDPAKLHVDKLKILTKDKKGNFTVFGKIESWDSPSSRLVILPLAMY